MNKRYEKTLTSVIITCHNYGRFLEKCIDSAINQTMSVKEIIVINDSSSDNTDIVAQKFYKQIKYYEVDFRNPQKTRNFGLAKASGEFIIFLDADDYFELSAIEQLQNKMQCDTGLCLVYADRYNIGDKKLLKRYNLSKLWKSVDYNYSILENFNYIPLPSLIRKQKFSGFDERITRFQDWDAWLTLLENGCRAVRIKQPLYYARFHGSNLTIKSSTILKLIVFFSKRHSWYEIPFVILKSKILYEKYYKKI